MGISTYCSDVCVLFAGHDGEHRYRDLNSRELDYLARLALNATRKGIAAEDGVSVRYVSAVVERGLGKLGTDSIIEGFRRLGWLKAGRSTW